MAEGPDRPGGHPSPDRIALLRARNRATQPSMSNGIVASEAIVSTSRSAS